MLPYIIMDVPIFGKITLPTLKIVSDTIRAEINFQQSKFLKCV